MRVLRRSVVLAAVVIVVTAWLCVSHTMAAAVAEPGHTGHDAPTMLCDLETGCVTAAVKLPVFGPAVMPPAPTLAPPARLGIAIVATPPASATPPRRSTVAPRAPPG